MARHVISVCIFCFICATHSPCASHAAIGQENLPLHREYNDPNNPPLVEKLQITSREKVKLKPLSAGAFHDVSANPLRQSLPLPKYSLRIKRHSDNYNDSISLSNNKSKKLADEDANYLRRIFLKYGDGDTMTMEGFEKLINNLNLLQVLVKNVDSNLNSDSNSSFNKSNDGSSTNNSMCINQKEITSLVQKTSNAPNAVDHTTFIEACPALLYNLVAGRCTQAENEFHVHDTPIPNDQATLYVWLYSISAVFVISFCGVLSLVIIPVMQNRFYKPLIQFLVALAVGTLAGDALLHLLPHAMSEGSHSDSLDNGHEGEHHDHTENMWKGFVAMMGLTFFFIMEKFILFAGKWRKGKQKHKSHSKIKVVNEGRDATASHTNDTQCMDKYSSYPYCYKDIINNPNTTFLDTDKTATTLSMLELGSNSDMPSFRKSLSPTSEKLETNQNMTECPGDLTISTCTEVNKMLPNNTDKELSLEDFTTVILREHETNHHGHSHTHGHVHSAPKNFSSVAWMVIMGDGLHNFTDGMAIGAAFSGGYAGGFSTAVAVFCHELPHELGDFAMLLKAGMSIKQALYYNLLSSVLCFLGNIFGVWLGNTEYASSWVFAAAAGMFIYIALVDMIPELSSAHEDEGNFTQCVLHLSGLLLGFGIMTLIALYENDLKNIFNDPK